MALQLYQLYQKVEAQGEDAVAQMLENVYLAGNITSWEAKTPEEWAEIKHSIAENHRVLQERMMAEQMAESVTDEVVGGDEALPDPVTPVVAPEDGVPPPEGPVLTETVSMSTADGAAAEEEV